MMNDWWRYIAVTQPLKYARHKNHKRVWLTIGLVWAISVAIGLPIVLGLNNTERRIPTDCGFYNADFVIYSSLSSFYIPCIIMIFLYYQIFKVITSATTTKFFYNIWRFFKIVLAGFLKFLKKYY
jgi:dopamine receptor D2